MIVSLQNLFNFRITKQKAKAIEADQCHYFELSLMIFDLFSIYARVRGEKLGIFHEVLLIKRSLHFLASGCSITAKNSKSLSGEAVSDTVTSENRRNACLLGCAASHRGFHVRITSALPARRLYS